MSSLKDKRSSRTEANSVPAAGPADVVIGRLVGVGEDGAPLVEFAGNPAGQPVRALATARYDDAASGTAVALMFVGGDRARPLAIGVVSQPEATAATPEERLTFTAAREIVLQCGRASIVLTRAGKVLVRGAYVSLRSSGMQRITGASVQIN
jgi:Domain of unknown function (DUF6484)